MTENEKALTVPETDWRPRIFVVGGLVGAFLGLLSAYFYVKTAEEIGDKQPTAPSSSDTVRLGLSLLSIIRTISEWGSR